MTFRLGAGRRDQAHAPADRLDQRRAVGRRRQAALGPGGGDRPAQDLDREGLGRLGGPERRAVDRRRDAGSSAPSARLSVSATGRAAMAPVGARQPPRRRRRRSPASAAGGRRRGPAPPRSRAGRPRAPPPPTPSGSRHPPPRRRGSALPGDGLDLAEPVGRGDDHERADAGARPQRGQAPCEHGAAREPDQGLRNRRAHPDAGSGGDDDRGGGRGHAVRMLGGVG